MDHLQRLDKITEKVNVLLKKNEQQQKDYADVKGEKDQLQALLKERNAKVEELEEHLKVMKLAKNVSAGGEGGNDEDKAELKKKINEFIKEIDKCVALLNN